MWFSTGMHVNIFENDHLHPEPDDGKNWNVSFCPSFNISEASLTLSQRITLVDTNLLHFVVHSTMSQFSTSITSTIGDSIKLWYKPTALIEDAIFLVWGCFLSTL